MLRRLHLLLSLGLVGALPLAQACTITTTPSSPASECTDSTECPGVACSDGSTQHLCDDVLHVCVTDAADVCPAAAECVSSMDCPAVACPDGTTQHECSNAGACVTDPAEVCGTAQCTPAAGTGLGGSHCDTDLASAPTDTCSIRWPDHADVHLFVLRRGPRGLQPWSVGRVPLVPHRRRPGGRVQRRRDGGVHGAGPHRRLRQHQGRRRVPEREDRSATASPSRSIRRCARAIWRRTTKLRSPRSSTA